MSLRVLETTGVNKIQILGESWGLNSIPSFPFVDSNIFFLNFQSRDFENTSRYFGRALQLHVSDSIALYGPLQCTNSVTGWTKKKKNHVTVPSPSFTNRREWTTNGQANPAMSFQILRRWFTDSLIHWFLTNHPKLSGFKNKPSLTCSCFCSLDWTCQGSSALPHTGTRTS